MDVVPVVEVGRGDRVGPPDVQPADRLPAVLERPVGGPGVGRDGEVEERLEVLAEGRVVGPAVRRADPVAARPDDEGGENLRLVEDPPVGEGPDLVDDGVVLEARRERGEEPVRERRPQDGPVLVDRRDVPDCEREGVAALVSAGPTDRRPFAGSDRSGGDFGGSGLLRRPARGPRLRLQRREGKERGEEGREHGTFVRGPAFLDNPALTAGPRRSRVGCRWPSTRRGRSRSFPRRR